MGSSRPFPQKEEEDTMLVLSRKKKESIIIGDGIVLTVIEIRGDKVRLGFEAPKEVPIHRQEVYDAIHRKGTAKKTDTVDPLASLVTIVSPRAAAVTPQCGEA